MSKVEILKPPESVRGMTKLEKDKFNVEMKFPVLEVDATDVGVISRRVRLEPYLIGHKLKPLKNLMDSENSGKKYLVFNPENVRDEPTKSTIISLLERELGADKTSKLNWTDMPKVLTFENWDSKSLIKSILPDGLDYSSYTQTGHIVHCNFKETHLDYRFVIAEILLNKINKCRTVVQKGNIITNVYRNLDLELLAGEEDYITELREEGLRYKLDFSKVYWNSRLSFEHSRVISNFDNQSIVYDACCGIGPFVLPAYVKRKPKRILANDLNPDSVKWLKVNMDLNKIGKDKIEVFNMDANEFLRINAAEDAIDQMESWQKLSDDERPNRIPQIHIVMNLPAYAVNFLPTLRGILKNRTKLEEIEEKNRFRWNVYCYLFAKSHVDVEKEWYEEEARRMVDEKIQWDKSLVVSCHNVRTVSSRKEMYCVHLNIPYEYLTADPFVDLGTEEPNSKKARV